jgi:Polyketide cyclase / dehydrase and lipid transport
MASIRREILIDVPPTQAWDALRDWSALHERLVPGFAVATKVDGRDRMVTFFNGTVYRERIIGVDDVSQRLVWSIVDGPYQHHNASAQVLEADHGGTRFVWITDLLPDEAAERTTRSMEQALKTIKQTLETMQPSCATVEDG